MSREKKTSSRAFYLNLAPGVTVLFICAAALFLRTYFPQSTIYRDGGVYFKEVDPYYHLRLIENLVTHFPRWIAFDPYTYFPYGSAVPVAPLFDEMIVFVAWVLGMGAPSSQLTQTVALYFPAVLGALVVPLVYLVGKELFNRKAGLVAATLIAILPGFFLVRSSMGFTDHHVAETFFSTLTALFMTLALKSGTESRLTLAAVKSRDWKRLRKTIVYAALAGLSLGLYLLAWIGGPLLVFMIFCAAIILYLIDYLRKESTDYLAIIFTPVFLVALIVVLPSLGQVLFADLSVMALSAGILLLPALKLAAFLTQKGRLARALYPLVLVAFGMAGAGGLFLLNRDLFISILSKFELLVPNTARSTIGEAHPLLAAQGFFSLQPAFGEYTTGVVMAPVALGVYIWSAIKKTSPEKWFFVVWTAVMLAATLAQTRFSYYFEVNVAILGGYFILVAGKAIVRTVDWLRLPIPGKSRSKALPGPQERWAARAKRQAVIRRPVWARAVSYLLVVALVISLVIYPNMGIAIAAVSGPPGPSKDWYDSLVWLRDNTPDPFAGSPDFYYQYYDAPMSTAKYDYPPSAYGIMSWWDYGHYITQISHRIPNANPMQEGAMEAGKFFLAQEEASASKMLDDLGSRYVIIDSEMAIPLGVPGEPVQIGKYSSMALWAGENPGDYFDTYYVESNGEKRAVLLYFPAYYRSMVVRLYNFNGRAIIPGNVTVVNWAATPGYKKILSLQEFPTYEDATTFVTGQKSGNYQIVGTGPFESPVPLEVLTHFKPIHHSDSSALVTEDNVASYFVEIFQYSP